MFSTRPGPASREIPLSDPRIALDALAHLPHPFLLHSGLAEPRGRWSFFGADPFETFGPERYLDAVALWRAERSGVAGEAMGRSPAEERAVAPPAPDAPDPPPFTGGLIGCWSYDFGRRLESIPRTARDDTGWPDVWLAAYDVIGAFDHATGRAWLYSSGLPEASGDRTRRAAGRLDHFTRLLSSGSPAGATARAFARPYPAEAGRRSDEGARDPTAARSTFGAGAYRDAVERVREHIRRGDIFQANLSQRWTASRAIPGGAGHPDRLEARSLFHALADHSPAPFAAFVDLGDRAVASASPERFLEVRGRRVETRPIKGTRPRGAGAAADAIERAALLASAKDRAENVMIVDVLRNDLGRVCETGSVRVPELCALETFAQVHHLTSTVTGTLGAGQDAVDLLHACFPGGSITGAPKIRAMEIIESLEPVGRALYTGAIGYLDWSGNADWSIAIRTALVTGDEVHFAAGGGITADSDPDAEYHETLAKAEGWRLAMAACGRPILLGEFEAGAAGEHERPADAGEHEAPADATEHERPADAGGPARVPELRS
jgi:para-aminobenzoate synthetase component 1